MSNLHSHLKIALESIRCFTDDGTLDTNELNYLLGIAKADGKIDEDEKRVLALIISKAMNCAIDPKTAKRISEIKTELSI
jgi:hypothetical protein